MTLSDQIAEYLAALRTERGLSRNTIAAYGRDLRDYAAALGTAAPSPERASAFVQGLRARGLAPSSIARKVSALRGFHRFLVVEGLAADDPTVMLDAPRRPRGLPQALTVEQVVQLLEAPAAPRPVEAARTEAGERRYWARVSRDRALVEMMYATGARVSEIAVLQQMDLDLPDPGASPETGTARLTGKGNRQRIVPVGRHACRAVREYLIHRTALIPPGRAQPGELFISDRGRRLSRQAIWDIVRRRAESAGLEPGLVWPHVLRHSAATHMVEGGADLRVVQEFLGHATISTTQVYTRVAPRHLLEVYATSHPRST